MDNDAFYEKAERSFRELFEAARKRDELQSAFSLNPEFRGLQRPGWSTAAESSKAFDEYVEFIGEGDLTRLKARVALAFYCHLAEAAGLYEVPKNMLRVADGEPYNLWPFSHLVKQHALTGKTIAPNSNKVLRDLAGHAQTSGFVELAEVFRDAFDGDLRNGYSHADYVVWDDGIRLPMRNGGNPRIVAWSEFHELFHRGVNFYIILRNVIAEFVGSYCPEKQIRGRLDDESERTWTIRFDPTVRTLSISG